MKFKDLNGRIQGKNINKYKRISGQSSKSKNQAKLGDILISIWPNTPIYEEVPCVGINLYLDFYIPSLSLAIEFQGDQHYEYVPFFHRNRYGYMRSILRDDDKTKWCEINNIKLVLINEKDLTIEKIKEICRR